LDCFRSEGLRVSQYQTLKETGKSAGGRTSSHKLDALMISEIALALLLVMARA